MKKEIKRSAVEIICSRCGQEAFLRREPVYEGLKKTGERLSCPLCGEVFESEEHVPFKNRPDAPRVFSEDDRAPRVEAFDSREQRRFCRYCAEYTVNPFMQYCARHKKEVEATGSCEQFKPVSDRNPTSADKPADPFSRLFKEDPPHAPE